MIMLIGSKLSITTDASIRIDLTTQYSVPLLTRDMTTTLYVVQRNTYPKEDHCTLHVPTKRDSPWHPIHFVQGAT